MPRPLTDYAFTAGLLFPLLAITIQRDWSGSDFSAGLLGLQDSLHALARRVDDLEDKGIAPAPTHAYSHTLRTYVNLYTIILPAHSISTGCSMTAHISLCYYYRHVRC